VFYILFKCFYLFFFRPRHPIRPTPPTPHSRTLTCSLFARSFMLRVGKQFPTVRSFPVVPQHSFEEYSMFLATHLPSLPSRRPTSHQFRHETPLTSPIQGRVKGHVWRLHLEDFSVLPLMSFLAPPSAAVPFSLCLSSCESSASFFSYSRFNSQRSSSCYPTHGLKCFRVCPFSYRLLFCPLLPALSRAIFPPWIP